MPPPPKQKFIEGEKVLCYHGPLIYEAKCLKSSVTKDKLIKYFVHYAGWSKNWDEWVPEARVLKYNDINVAKQKEVLKNHSTPAKPKKTKGKAKSDVNNTKESESRAATPVSDTSAERKAIKTKASTSVTSASILDTTISTSEPSKKKRGKLDIQPEEELVSEIKIKLPEELKNILADDWTVIHKQKKLWSLPAATTVDDILKQYLIHKKQVKCATGINRESVHIEVTKGIREYFNNLLNAQLLYTFERQQFEENVKDAEASAIYGGIHLLRMFIRLGSNLGLTSLDAPTVQIIVEQFEDFLKYLIKTSGSWFNLQEMYNPTHDYLKKNLN